MVITRDELGEIGPRDIICKTMLCGYEQGGVEENICLRIKLWELGMHHETSRLKTVKIEDKVQGLLEGVQKKIDRANYH